MRRTRYQLQASANKSLFAAAHASARSGRYVASLAPLILYDGLLRLLGPEMRRREFLIALGGVAAVEPLAAQQADRLRRIGFLRVGLPPAAFIGSFQKGLREQGLVEDRHFVIEYS